MPTPKPCEKCNRNYYPLRRGFCNRCDSQRRAKIGYECSLVDAEPARQHIRKLNDAGVGLHRIASLAGLRRKTLMSLMHGRTDRGSAPSRRISKQNAQAILSVPVPDNNHHPVVAPHAVVDATGTVRRLRALVAYGYCQSHLSSRLEITPTTLSRIIQGRADSVLASTARKVAALYCELEAIPGTNARAKAQGRKLNWKVPFAWDDDIDDPQAQADDLVEDKTRFCDLYVEMRELGYTPREILAKHQPTKKERVNAVELMIGDNLTAASVAELMGVSPRSVERYKAAYRMPVKADWIKQRAG